MVQTNRTRRETRKPETPGDLGAAKETKKERESEYLVNSEE